MRDIVLVAGTNAAGKTKALHTLARSLRASGVATDPRFIVDGRYLLERVLLDDRNGGYGHYHDWCVPTHRGAPHGHVHDGRPTIPFAVDSQNIIDGMLFDFFSELSRLPRDGTIHFAELAAGRNTSRPFQAQSAIDLSFHYIARLLELNALPREWIHRLLAVVHPYTDQRLRHEVLVSQSPTAVQEVAEGVASPEKLPSTLDVFGRDDFSAFAPLLREEGTYRIYDVRNDFTPGFSKEIKAIARQINGATNRTPATKRRGIILVWGQDNGGQSRIISQMKYLAAAKSIPYENEVVSDLPLLVDEVKADDVRNGGKGHYHNWCEGNTSGHAHTIEHSDRSFTVFDNAIIDATQQRYFAWLEALPQTGALWFGEMCGGENINPFSEPAYVTDCSFRRIAQRLEDQTYPSGWMDRVLAVIHPIASRKVREEMNASAYIESFKGSGRALLRGRTSQTVLDIFGIDDFECVEPLFRRHNVPQIFTIRNDGAAQFFLRLEGTLDDLLEGAAGLQSVTVSS
jgi:hypothetical protein